MKKIIIFILISTTTILKSQDIIVTLDLINPLGWPFVWTLGYGEDSTLYAGDETGKLWIKKKESVVWSQVTSLAISGGTDITAVRAFTYDDIWVGTEGKGLYHYDGTAWTNYTKANSGLPFDQGFMKIIKDSNGDYWFSIKPGGLLKRSGTSWTIYDKTNSPQSSSSISFIMLGNDDSIWAVSSEKIFNIKNGVWKTYNIEVLFPQTLPNIVSALYQDNEGSIWASTSKGIFKFENNIWISKTDISGNASVQTLVIDKKGSIWYLEYGEGLVRYNNGTKIRFLSSNNSNIPTQAWELITNSKNEKLLVGNQGAAMIIINDDAILSSSKDLKVTRLNIYPNPTTDKIILDEDYKSGNTEFFIYDLLGKIFKNEILKDSAIDISYLSNGNYILKLKNSKEEKIASFIKI